MRRRLDLRWTDPLEGLGILTMRVVAGICDFPRKALGSLGEVVVLFACVIGRFRYIASDRRSVIRQMMDLGVASLPLIFVTSLFIGMVAAVSANHQFRDMVPIKYLGTVITQTIFLELGPVLTALVMSGRIGSSIAAQIGTMREKEEIDALEALGLDPLRFLAMPRLVTGLVMLPVLTIIACFLALLGAWAVAVLSLDVTSYTFVSGTRLFFSPHIVWVCLVKSAVFGVLITLLGYHHGIHAAGGAKGVGEATMRSVVASSVAILMFDFLIAFLMLKL